MLVLILRNYNALETRTFEQWSAILDLSTRWGFTSIRDLAIRCIKPPNPLDRLILARKHALEKWILPALLDLCERPEPLSLEEARLMDFEDVVLVGSVRQTVRSSTLTVDATEIGNFVRTWKSGKPRSPIPESPNKHLKNPFRAHLPQSSALFPTLKPTVQPIFNTGSVILTQPTHGGDEWGIPSGGKKKKGTGKR
jgi:hypothetical protein